MHIFSVMHNISKICMTTYATKVRCSGVLGCAQVQLSVHWVYSGALRGVSGVLGCVTSKVSKHT